MHQTNTYNRPEPPPPYGITMEEMKIVAKKMHQEFIENPEKARQFFIEMGLLNPDGTKSKYYYKDGV